MHQKIQNSKIISDFNHPLCQLVSFTLLYLVYNMSNWRWYLPGPWPCSFESLNNNIDSNFAYVSVSVYSSYKQRTTKQYELTPSIHAHSHINCCVNCQVVLIAAFLKLDCEKLMNCSSGLDFDNKLNKVFMHIGIYNTITWYLTFPYAIHAHAVKTQK